MLRQASSRNQRSKGFKVKHGLQIFLLVAICIWLLYQVKHSHEKKRAFEERNFKRLDIEFQTDSSAVNLPRKLLPHTEGTVSDNVIQKDEEIEEAQEEEQETKQEEVDEEEGRSPGDDEIDEQDQEKDDEDAEQGDDTTEEEERDNRDEGKDAEEDKDGQNEVDLFENQDREGGTQEAREENYKRDDASSAVVHDSEVVESEAGNGDNGSADEEQVVDRVDDDSGAGDSNSDNDSSANGSKSDADNDDTTDSDDSKGDGDSSANGSKSDVDNDDTTGSDDSKGDEMTDNADKKVEEAESVINVTDDGSQGGNDSSTETLDVSANNASDTLVEDNKIIRTDILSNVIAADTKVEESLRLADQPNLNSTRVESNSQTEEQTNSSAAAESNTTMNSTGAVPDNAKVVDFVGVSVSNDTVSLSSAQNLGENAQTVIDNSTKGEDGHDSENAAENLSTAENVEESSTVSSNDNGGESDDSLHAVMSEEEREARTDLSTLPDIQNEAKTSDDEAAE